MQKNLCNYTLINLCCTCLLFVLFLITYLTIYFLVVGIAAVPSLAIVGVSYFAETNAKTFISLIDTANNILGTLYNTLFVTVLNLLGELAPPFFSILNMILRFLKEVIKVLLSFVCDTDDPTDISQCPIISKMVNFITIVLKGIINTIIYLVNLFKTIILFFFGLIICNIDVWKHNCEYGSDGKLYLPIQGLVYWLYEFFEWIVRIFFYFIAYIIAVLFEFVGRFQLKLQLDINNSKSILVVLLETLPYPLYFWHVLLRFVDIYVISMLDRIVCVVKTDPGACVIQQICLFLFKLPWPLNWIAGYVCSRFGSCPCYIVPWVFDQAKTMGSDLVSVPCEVPYPANLDLCLLTKLLEWYSTAPDCYYALHGIKYNLSRCWITIGG